MHAYGYNHVRGIDLIVNYIHNVIRKQSRSIAVYFLIELKQLMGHRQIGYCGVFGVIVLY